ncbi:MAG: outer membrane lipoprotein-sorting protein [Pseudomonadales bacterium]|nr:outer membrane lipoprotein-sorting protein [Pseudomonadales bacterium]
MAPGGFVLRKHAIFAPILLLAVFGSVNLAAESPDTPTARQVIKQMEELYREDASKAELTMRVETPHYERTMTMTSMSLGEENAFIRILSPRKDRGIATLKLDNEMWNYFPKINKVIKVPPSMMMGSWMGSDFTNDDLVKETTLADEYDLSLEETEATYEITLSPKKDTVTLWAKILYIVDKEKMLPIAQIFFDDNGEKVRRLAFKEPREFSGKMLPSVLEMIPLNKEGHRTVVIYNELEFNPDDVTEDVFTLRNLQSRF